jgi:hypothetical protein
MQAEAPGVITNQATLDAWDLRDAEARIVIYCNVESSLQVLVEGIQSAAEMWERLLLQFAQAAPANANIMQARFFEYRYNKGRGFCIYIYTRD